MKAILISDHAKWCALMMNGDKKIEVRKGTALYKATKKLIDEYGYADIYVYCTKEESLRFISFKGWCNGNDWKKERPLASCSEDCSGKVAFKFRCYDVEEIYTWFERDSGDSMFYTNDLEYYELEKKSCLSLTELQNYFTKLLEEDKDTVGYAIHISDLEIFDKPKELSEFYHYVKYNKEMATLNNQDWDFCKLTKAPQSWCYIEIRG